MAFEAWWAEGRAATLDAIVGKVAEELGNTPTIGMMVGVFIASISAVIGGRLRGRHR